MEDFATDDLVILMTLAGYQHQVAIAGRGDGPMNCFASIGNLFIGPADLLNAGFGIRKNLFRIFCARIV